MLVNSDIVYKNCKNNNKRRVYFYFRFHNNKRNKSLKDITFFIIILYIL